MNPLKNIFLRVTGIAPLIGPMPLSVTQYKQLFKADPAFVDYFPIDGYDAEHGVFTMTDGINVGAIWQLSAADMDAKPVETLSLFNDGLALALQQLPQESTPYIIQIFLQNADVENFGDALYENLPEQLREDKLSLAVAEMMRRHSTLLTHEMGAFADSRVSQEKGWRVSTQKIFVCVYRNESEAYWAKQRKKPAQKIIDDCGAFLAALNGLRIQAKPVDDYNLIRWLAPYFSAGYDKIISKSVLKDKSQLANFDLGQECFAIQPEYQVRDEIDEKGIWKFGDRYIRYLTTQGLESVPKDGCLTISHYGGASIWEQMPPGTMMAWTIVPQPKVLIDAQIESVMASAQQSASHEAQYTYDQAIAAKNECLRNNQRIFYTQIGAFISAPDLDTLFDRTTIASDILSSSNCLSFIKPEYDLISQDSFIRAIPFVYDFRHDRKNALRARMTYLSQLASTLPLFGSGRGSENICYLTFKRSGEPFTCNPFLKSDRSRVAHQVVFGPTGSGKSATMIYKAMMSMAVNDCRQFILDKGNSFGLLADFYEAHGKKVRRLTFNAASKDTFPPFFETEAALREANNERIIITDDTDNDDDDEERSYLSEMLNILKIMVTGGKQVEADRLKQADISFLQSCLIEGLRASVTNGDPHARPQDIYEAMLRASDAEKITELAIRYRDFAAAIKLWTEGPRGRLFNQHGNGFDANADLTLIETGSLTNEGNEDMFAVAGLATLTNITALGEKTQYDGRHIEVFTDEGHFWMRLPLLIRGMIQATKVWRKLGIWLIFATQDFTDFDKTAKQILSQAEFWWLLSMGEDEAKQISNFKDLTNEEHYLIRQAKIEKPNYSEGTMLSERFGCGLNRYIPPSLILALAQTDADEKNARKKLMVEQSISELEAAYIIAEGIEQSRRKWQNT